MSSETLAPGQTPPTPVPRKRRSARGKAQSSLLSQGEPMLWLTGGALAMSLAMIIGLIGLILVKGTGTFWPLPLTQIRIADGNVYLGEITSRDVYFPDAATPNSDAPSASPAVGVHRRMFRIENYEVFGTEHFRWIDDSAVVEESRPKWAVTFERQENGRFYAFPKAFTIDGQVVASTPADAWAKFQEHHAEVRNRWHQQRSLQLNTVGGIKAAENRARIQARKAEMQSGKSSPAYATALAAYQQEQARAAEQIAEIDERIQQLNQANERFGLVVNTADGQEFSFALADIVRAFPANQLSWFGKLGVYLSRWWEFLSEDPRHANSEGGVYPAIFGTVVMTLLMSLAVTPFGVLAALYLREYAKKGTIVSAVRISINNLAGVPSIVFGVFGMGFFCYLVGGQIDDWFFPVEKADGNPTFGKGALVWASFTLALLTLPVVIVATEEALSAVPNSLREGSYACGASKWQTIRRIVLPRALPGIMTGLILAMARGAGEVAPLMLVGAVNEAQALPFDWQPPFGINRSFMHLGFQIYDVGFQSQNSEAAKPMVFTTTLLLIAIIAVLNIAAVWLRGRLRKRYVSAKF